MSFETMAITRHAREVKERPISFSSRMVFEILQGRKTETRRMCKLPPKSSYEGQTYFELASIYKTLGIQKYGQKGDRLWVKETYTLSTPEKDTPNKLLYKADDASVKASWKSGRFMPKIACRLKLVISGITVQRLQDITEKEARAEGALYLTSLECMTKHFMTGKNPPKNHQSYRLGYRCIWDYLYAKGGNGWQTNPFVWRICFKIVTNESKL